MSSSFKVTKSFITTFATCLILIFGHSSVASVEKTALAIAPESQWQTQLFISHSNWLAMNIDPVPVDHIRRQLDKILGVSLKSRGEEAHITVISPPEYKKIQSKLGMNELELAAHQIDIQRTMWTPICVARGVDQQNSRHMTYYIVVEAQRLLALRHEIFQRFVKNGGDPADFDPTNFHPHITIGYTSHDLHDIHGVIKDTRHCSFDLTTPDK